ncbi:hypothetical protein BCV72DRAFT_302013 [Rhizopus microsporus var. microsporus]|uniref:Uncharacterized protein n=2 Tax=Rhizopus microsporus TaxID=58291 RepID=A0A2G4T9Y2_RHIZD|nr:uncharacterized protein RHIMIDRAFT_288617 [Rhizopus microsporus ATCC 52813]ORE10235.1 hypothetical protein BCV72DRAFT_302013 [Rhizopus microsporus var. microsporus]PHZ17808.1 hypothetical protein RHIMIDRAFT_288617 [Rhizopus microsporus ATCC 52813]
MPIVLLSLFTLYDLMNLWQLQRSPSGPVHCSACPLTNETLVFALSLHYWLSAMSSPKRRYSYPSVIGQTLQPLEIVTDESISLFNFTNVLLSAFGPAELGSSSDIMDTDTEQDQFFDALES